MSGHAYIAPRRAPRRLARCPQRPGPAVGGPLRVAALCLAALVLMWVVAEHVPAVRLHDAIALHDFTLLNRPLVETAGEVLLHLLEPLSFVVLGAAIVFVALARGRPRVAAAVAVVMALAPLTAETLKPLLAHPHVRVGDVHIGPARGPAATPPPRSRSCCARCSSRPRALRPAVAAVGAAVRGGRRRSSLLILAWHMPSDVLGGYLVATLWMALAVAGAAPGRAALADAAAGHLARRSDEPLSRRRDPGRRRARPAPTAARRPRRPLPARGSRRG